MPLLINDIIKYVEENIPSFHQKRIKKIETLKLKEVLHKKNPYLFKAKNIQTADKIVKGIVDAYLSSSEEAIFINGKVYGGIKSGIKGIDLEFDNNNIRNLVSIKSGPNWGNSSQIEKMEPLGHKAKERNENYSKQYSEKINIFVKEFIEIFCNKNGSIEWEKLVRYNSSK